MRMPDVCNYGKLTWAGPSTYAQLRCSATSLRASLVLRKFIMAGRGSGVNLNLKVRTDVDPQQLLKEVLLFPLIYLRLLGIVSTVVMYSTL